MTGVGHRQVAGPKGAGPRAPAALSHARAGHLCARPDGTEVDWAHRRPHSSLDGAHFAAAVES
ncbi:MAG: hypothetical protein DLM57_13505 [Pseudonocardiales bacterium]|nr:MAG: hypothetical protein DLM57_13505 [Pseudonocardiales bacterium]